MWTRLPRLPISSHGMCEFSSFITSIFTASWRASSIHHFPRYNSHPQTFHKVLIALFLLLCCLSLPKSPGNSVTITSPLKGILIVDSCTPVHSPVSRNVFRLSLPTMSTYRLSIHTNRNPTSYLFLSTRVISYQSHEPTKRAGEKKTCT